MSTQFKLTPQDNQILDSVTPSTIDLKEKDDDCYVANRDCGPTCAGSCKGDCSGECSTSCSDSCVGDCSGSAQA